MVAYLYVEKEVVEAKGLGKERDVTITHVERYKVKFASKTGIRKWLRKRGLKKAFDPDMVEWREYGKFTKLADGSEISINYSYHIGL